MNTILKIKAKRKNVEIMSDFIAKLLTQENPLDYLQKDTINFQPEDISSVDSAIVNLFSGNPSNKRAILDYVGSQDTLFNAISDTLNAKYGVEMFKPIKKQRINSTINLTEKENYYDELADNVGVGNKSKKTLYHELGHRMNLPTITQSPYEQHRNAAYFQRPTEAHTRVFANAMMLKDSDKNKTMTIGELISKSLDKDNMYRKNNGQLLDFIADNVDTYSPNAGYYVDKIYKSYANKINLYDEEIKKLNRYSGALEDKNSRANIPSKFGKTKTEIKLNVTSLLDYYNNLKESVVDSMNTYVKKQQQDW